MDYSKIYDNLMYDARKYPKSEIYKEKHHIKPRCLGGEDSSENIILLTARQHYLAHWLLYKMHKTSALVHAWNCMSVIGKGQEARHQNSHLFEYCKKQRKQFLSKQYSGEGNNFYGKAHTEETKRKLSEIHSGKIYKTPEQIQEWVETVAKKPKSTEHRSKISRPGFLMLQNVNTLEIIRIPKNDPRANMSEWVNPRKIVPEKKYKCLYCDVVTGAGNLKRWHNDKCKRKLNNEN